MRILKETKNKLVALDFETIPGTFEPEIMSFYWDNGQYVFDLLAMENWKEVLFEILDDCSGLLAHNIDFELQVLDFVGYDVTKLYGKIFDTMPMLHVLNTESKLGLKDHGNLIGMDLSLSWKEAYKKPRNEYMDYCQTDSEACYKLMSTLFPKLKEMGVYIAYQIEIEMIWVLRSMRQTGIYTDKNFLLELGKQTDEKLIENKKELITLAGKVINFNSSQQLANTIFNDLKANLKDTYKTEKGNISVKENVITEVLRDKDTPGKAKQFCETLLKYKENEKFKGSFLSEKALGFIGPDSRLRPRFWSLGTATSRFSSSEPNIQQTPSQGDGFIIRKAYCAPPGNALICSDLSQAEYRMMAHFSRDKDLIKMYHDGGDIHKYVSEQLGIDRFYAKRINFGLLYGMGVAKLAASLGITEKEAQSYLNKYFSRFPGVKVTLDSMVFYTRHSKQIKIISGRIRDMSAYTFVDNMAKNTPIQGAVAEYIKLAMISLWKKFNTINVKLIMQVHDELIFECPERDAEWAAPIIKNVMETVHPLSVPMVTEPKIVKSWYEAK